MTALWIFFALAMLLYVAISIALQAGLRRLPQRFAEFSPTVSILIAARNEEAHLARCLEALLLNEYPPNRLEILVIDDLSTDGTRRIAEDFARRAGHVRLITLDRRLDGMSGKASAICQGMDQARGEIILVTDADCAASPHWVRSMISGFTPEVGMVGGFTVLSEVEKPADGFFTRVQTVDWIYLLAVGAGAAGLGKPVSILGNNFGFRREVYDAVGGYRRLGFTIIEDFALMNAMLRETPWRARFLMRPGATIASHPPLTWRSYIDQRKRWAAGGKEVSGFGKLLLVAGFLRHAATIIALIFAKPLLPVIAGIALASLADFLLVAHTTNRLHRREALKHFPLFQIYFMLYSLLLAPVVALPTTVRWKDVAYHWGLGRRMHKIEDPPSYD